MAGGRPSKYESHVHPKLLLIEAWARNGITDKDISEKLGVSHDSFIEYKKQYPELVESLKNGKEVIDTMVENALLKAALGYQYEETKETADGYERMNKVAHPNTTALIFWLKNRNQKDWRDKQDVEAINHNSNQDITNLPPDERRARIDELNRRRGTGTDNSS